MRVATYFTIDKASQINAKQIDLKTWDQRTGLCYAVIMKYIRGFLKEILAR